jgi:hypothetical protein
LGLGRLKYMDREILTKAFDGLKTHPEATLAGLSLFLGAAMAISGVNLLFSGGLPIAIYLIYYFRMVRDDKRSERLAELEVQRLERTAGLEARQRSIKALERRQKSDGKQ